MDDPAVHVTGPPGLGEFQERHGGRLRGPDEARLLHGRLSAACAAGPVERRLEAFEALLDWVLRRSRALPPSPGDPRSARLRLLLLVLEEEPGLREPFAASLREVLGAASVVRLLCSTGLPGGTGLFSELGDRLYATLMPEPPDEGDLARALRRAFRRRVDVAWLSALEPDLAERFVRLCFDAGARRILESGRRRALEHVATRVAALGLAEDVMVRDGEDDGAFLGLSREGAAAEGGTQEAAEDGGAIARCRAACARVREHVERHGVSTDLVFRLECIGQGLDRLEALRRLDLRVPDAARAAAIARLLAEVLRDASRQSSIVGLLRSSSRQLARKVVERAGTAGEHYATATRGDWFRMLASASGGGALTAGTTVLKFCIAWTALPLFFEGLFHSANYAAGFLVMAFLGMTLATKQPSATAAWLAGALRGAGHGRDFGPLVAMVARVTRSQLAAVAGNLGVVIPACALFHFWWLDRRAEPFLDAATAAYVVHSLQPLAGPTVLYAAVTGVFLWMSSLAAGWLENWVVYRRLPEALAAHRVLRAVAGRRVAGAVGNSVRRLSGILGGNVGLGVLLGMSPAVARFFGLPLDVRHVTLSTGALTLALLALGPAAFEGPEAGLAIAGIAAIALMNFGVSFACALLVAMRAQEVGAREGLRALGAVLRELGRRPGRFFLPPRRTDGAAGPAARG